MGRLWQIHIKKTVPFIFTKNLPYFFIPAIFQNNSRILLVIILTLKMISLTVSLLSVNLSYHFREKLYFLGYDLSSRKYEFLLGKINYVFYGIFWKSWKNFKNLFTLILRRAKIAVLSDLHWVSQKLLQVYYQKWDWISHNNYSTQTKYLLHNQLQLLIIL